MEYKLRPLDLSDIDSLVKHANNRNVSAFMTDRFPNPYTRKDAVKFIKMFKDKDPQEVLAIDVDGEIVGAVGVHPMEDVLKLNAEIGYWIGEEYWGKGIVARAVRELVDYAFATFEIDRIIARIYGNNPASRRVAEKAGFKQEAFFEKTIVKYGEVLDEYIYAIRK